MREHYQMLADKDSKPHVYAIAAQARHLPPPALPAPAPAPLSPLPVQPEGANPPPRPTGLGDESY